MQDVVVRIEIPFGSRAKYEINKETGVLEVDRMLAKKIPYNYGYIPGTLWDDGDALDVIIIDDEALQPLCEVSVKPIAIIKMYDQGVSDWKVVACLDEFMANSYMSLFHKMVEEYLTTYKTGVEIKGVITDEKEIEKHIRAAWDAREKEYRQALAKSLQVESNDSDGRSSSRCIDCSCGRADD